MYSNVLRLNGEVTHEAVAELIESLERCVGSGASGAVLVVSSHGGDVSAAVYFAQYYETFMRGSLKLTTYAMGMCGSSALVIFAAGDERYVHNDAVLYFHQPSVGLSGDIDRIPIEIGANIALSQAMADYMRKRFFGSSSSGHDAIVRLMDGAVVGARTAVRKGIAHGIIGERGAQQIDGGENGAI